MALGLNPSTIKLILNNNNNNNNNNDSNSTTTTTTTTVRPLNKVPGRATHAQKRSVSLYCDDS